MLDKFFSFRGRISRKMFIQYWLTIIMTALVLRVVFSYMGIPILADIVYMALIFSQISLVIRRCHDLGHDKWPTLGIAIVSALPPLSLVVIIYLMVAKGNIFDNMYGEAPRD